MAYYKELREHIAALEAGNKLVEEAQLAIRGDYYLTGEKLV